MSHKRRYKDRKEDENNDLEYYDNKVNSLKKTVKQMYKIKRRKKEISELERKRRKILKKMDKHHH
ncbi:hypothetical protein [Clostridium tyrobutyricum]|uniref:hypothetical protein n=1 Tax=Clostridium tyrobutyricum TaxID=1519 RepID=UPI002013BEF0|nr:hypothetical protein [Clostridium tyrobutyricum]MBR9648847.1 hypothetical protein [Clostridium tyrobutyricum]